MKQNLHLSNWLLAIILSLCSALSTYAEIITIGKFNYALNEKEKTATVFFYDHYASDNIPSVIVVPSTVTYNHKTYKVTSLSDNCFAGYEKLKSVTLPEGITSIGGGSFQYCI